MDKWIGNPSCVEGGDVELGARTSKHILLFALDPLALSLSLLCALHLFILCIYFYMLGLVVCASLVGCT